MKESRNHSFISALFLILIIILAACGGGGSGNTTPQAGSLDTTFNTNGKVTTPIGSGSRAHAIAIQTDGKIVVAGNAGNGTNIDFALARYNKNGSLDTTFDTDGIVTTPIGSGNNGAYAIAIQTDGKIVVAGYAGNGTPYRIFALARYKTDGSLDTTFNTNGKVITPIGSGNNGAYAIAIQTDGKIVVAGYALKGTNFDFALARYNTDGSLDRTFDTDGKVTTPIGSDDDFAHAIAIQTDGKIVVAGDAYNDTNSDFALARYTFSL